jgi:fluoroacetyl-CoA thioesterase
VKRIPAGTSVRHVVAVEERMTVDFEQPEPGLGKLHGVYATYWLGRHFEMVSRKLTLPYLEEHDEGIGFELAIKHLAPTVPGMSVELEARFLRLRGNRVYCACRAVNSLGDLVGEGRTTQVILARDALAARLARLRERAEADPGQSSTSSSSR